MTDSNPMADLLAKVDALAAKVDALIPAPEEKEDIDPRLAKAEAALRKTLTGSFKQDRLDKMTLDEMLIAADLKEDFTPEVGIKPPTGGSKQDADIPAVPEQYRAHFSETMELI